MLKCNRTRKSFEPIAERAIENYLFNLLCFFLAKSAISGIQNISGDIQRLINSNIVIFLKPRFHYMANTQKQSDYKVE